MVNPETGQANFAENSMRSGCLPAAGASANSTIASPSASSSAASKLSDRRLATSGRTTSRSTTTSMSCLNFLSSAGDLIKFAIDLQALEAALHVFGDFLSVLALAPAHHRREQIKPRALWQSQ